MREYLRLAVALGERDPDALDYYYGPAALVADLRDRPTPIQQIGKAAGDLLTRMPALPADPFRREFLAGQLRAIVARAAFLQSARHSFDDESALFFGFRPSAEDFSSRAGVRRELAKRIPGRKSLAERFGQFDAKFMIPPEKVPAVMARALEECRARTLAHLKLPAGEHVTLEFVGNKPWAAYSYYHGNFQSTIQINGDFALTIDRALDLACHEGYPGHHVFNSLTDEYLVRGKHRAELFAQPTFSPQSFVSEAAATVAPDIAFPGADRARFERGVLFPLAGLKDLDAAAYVDTERMVSSLAPEELAVARDYVDEKLEFIRAADALEDRALMSHAEATIRYLNEFRTYVVTYTAGHDLMTRWIHDHSNTPGGAWGALHLLITRPEGFAVARY